MIEIMNSIGFDDFEFFFIYILLHYKIIKINKIKHKTNIEIFVHDCVIHKKN